MYCYIHIYCGLEALSTHLPLDFYCLHVLYITVCEACSQSYEGGLLVLAFLKKRIRLKSIGSICRSLLIKQVPQREIGMGFPKKRIPQVGSALQVLRVFC